MERGVDIKSSRPHQRSQAVGRWLSRRGWRRLKMGLAGALVAAVTAAGYGWWSSRPSEVAPVFALPASTGETVRLEDFRGKQPVVLVFYMVGT
jgi:hypothetical protein